MQHLVAGHDPEQECRGTLRTASRQPATASRLLAVARLMRLENCLLTAVCVWIGAAGISHGSRLLVAASVATALVLATGNVVNDLVDVDADAIGKPHRPLPSGLVAVRAACGIAIALAMAACAVAALFLTMQIQLLVAIELCVGIGYSLGFKRIPAVGSLIFAAQVGSAVALGAALVDRLDARHLLVAGVICSGVFLLELVKTFDDAICDALTGLRTLAHMTTVGQQRFIVGTAACVYLALAALGVSMLHGSLALTALILLPMAPFAYLSLFTALPAIALRRSIYSSKILWVFALVGLRLLLG